MCGCGRGVGRGEIRRNEIKALCVTMHSLYLGQVFVDKGIAFLSYTLTEDMIANMVSVTYCI